MPRTNFAPRWFAPLLLVAAATAQHEGVTTATPSAAGVDFLRDVRPILAGHCYSCHGPDGEERKGDLRLDRKVDAFEDRGDYAAVVAGKPDESELLLRVTSDDPEEVMPPPECDDALSAAEVAILRKWIADGAEWREHWAFVPPTRPAAPPVKDGAWAKGELDAFVLARLEAEGLRPSAAAPREAWLRRVTFDLIGLPPTPAELDAFVADESDDAFEKVIDRLLADERYGERMASDWLDVARYADSSGYQRDSSRQAWKWREWVIAALNDNMPFDRFTIEQLAGDLLPEPTLDQRIATGFNRNHPVNTEAGEELDEYRSAYVIDRVHTTATTWLGLTVACAQCHDHKYDPISQREFYSFYGFFNNIKEKDSGRGRNPKPAIAAPGPDDLPRLRDLEQRIEMLKQRLERDDPITDRFQHDWEQRARERLGAPIEWTTIRPTEFMARYGSRLVLRDDDSVLATGPTPSRDTYDLVFTPGKRRIQALRIEVLPDPSLPHGASGRADDGRFILSRLMTRMTNVSESKDPPPISFAVAAADVNQERDKDEHYLTAIQPGAFAPAVAVEDDGSGRRGFGGWSIAGDERKHPRHAVLVPLEPLESNEKSLLRMTLEHSSRDKFRSLIGRFRVSFTEDPRVREQLVPLAKSHWRSIGPFPAASVAAAYVTPFGPEKDLEAPSWKKKHEQPTLPKPAKAAPKVADAKKASTGEPAPKGTGKAAGKAADKTDAKPRATPAAKKDEEKAKAKDKEPDADEKAKKPRNKRIAWAEQRTWRDGSAATIGVSGPASAAYVSRRLTTGRPRTARIEFRGGVGARVWLNGKLVGDFPPSADAGDAPPKASAKPKFDPENFDPANFDPADFDPEMFADFDPEDFAAAMKRRSAAQPKPRELRIGLRKGENHLVVKLVGKGRDAKDRADAKSKAPAAMQQRGRSGGGISFSFELVPEGDDVLDYETQLAVRAREGVAYEPKPVPASFDEEPKKKKKQLTPAERHEKAVRRWYRANIDPAGRVLAAELKKLEREKEALEAELPSALVMEELDEPRELRVFVRGDYRNRGDEVEIGTPSMLPPMPADLPRNRLGLARWLVSGEHPLTARVTVNRAWQQFFGRGLVSTAEDFGIRGAVPSHPALLDWLATEFVQSGWDLKKLHRQLVLSATYRQGYEVDAAARERDPDNTLLARGPHQRLSAEMVRDQALAVSGLLKQKLGGESVKPHQPAGLWRATLGSGKWSESKGDDRYRRGLYVYWKRGVPYPSFMAFDASKRETCTVTRTRTTTPLQALVTLNDPVYVEAGRHLGKRLLDEAEDGADDAARIAHGFRLVASRAPDPKEVEVLSKLLVELRAHYTSDEKAAKAVLGIAEEKAAKKADGKDAPKAPPKPRRRGRVKRSEQVPPAEAAAWAQLGCTLLNLEAAIRRG